jgi:hypothetical protein
MKIIRDPAWKLCTEHNLKPIGAVRLQLVDLSMKDGTILQCEAIDGVIICQSLMCSVCGHIELIELSGVVHDEEVAASYSASSHT